MAGSIGGNNANSANIVTGIFAATGQDIAQVVESSNCLTYMEMQGSSLYMRCNHIPLNTSCTMPCIEVGTVGGGTILPSQRACLDLLKLEKNQTICSAANLALIICSAVLCCELSLLASLCTGTLVSSHMKFNRSTNGIITCHTY
ncbi:hypothetical protein MXB_2035 [Myxobolus squamalis]|nr:hypothetical protein MXB_2035 [Myxobolus squamalis]